MLNESRSLSLPGRAHQRHAPLFCFMKGKVVSTKPLLPFISGWLAAAPRTPSSPAHAHICATHARSRTYCTQAGCALIPDCFGFCGGSIRLLFKLRAKPVLRVCARAFVCRSVMMDPHPVLGIALFQMLLLAGSSTGPLLSPCILSDTSAPLLSGSSAVLCCHN